MGSAAAIMECGGDADLEAMLACSAPMQEVEGQAVKIVMPTTTTDLEQGILEAEDEEMLSSAACEQILDKLMVAGNNSSCISAGGQLPPLSWEDSFEELFPDLA